LVIPLPILEWFGDTVLLTSPFFVRRDDSCHAAVAS
jgi:hypothetical protein